MNRLLLSIVLLSITYIVNAQKNLADTTYLQPVEITAVRAADKTPVAKSNLSKKDIAKVNIGQDLPFILNQTPSVVVNSDAGNGIGYTGIRIRGTDASRINVTLNGIPYNDAESQGTFFVDVPDLASSANGIQIQRGVGTSTNGAGSFGGSINIGTNEIVTKKAIEFNNAAGSYGSLKNTLSFNSGLIGKHFTVDGRLSNLRSDGYIDRASSRLSAVYGSVAYIDTKSSLRFNILSGKEKTYQAWNGIDEATLKTNRRYNSAGTDKPGDPYINETDNFIQTHYQLFYNYKFNPFWKANIAVFLTKGKGYYEQYKAGEALSKYGLPEYIVGLDTTRRTDLVRRLWLDNDFYGTIFSVQYESAKRQLIFGGGANEYKGDHFGEVKWAAVQAAVPVDHRWYFNKAVKKDGSFYTKWTEKIGKNWQTFLDLQVRAVDYRINGFRDNPGLTTDKKYFFFNPKAGITYSINKTQVYLSYARANKEPNRDDFEAGASRQPKAESLNDIEAGMETKTSKSSFGVNMYYMFYRNQLVLTGQINDVGAYTRTNIPKSYRAGVELQGSYTFSKYVAASANVTLSKNKVKNFTEYIDDYDNGGQKTNFYKTSDIAFSPDITGAATISITPLKNFGVDLISKYVSRQYLDNTSQKSRSLNGYYTQDVRATYTISSPNIKEVKFFAQVNNLFSKKYEPNGYTFSYFAGGAVTTENYYFPMAPVNFMAGVNIAL